MHIPAFMSRRSVSAAAFVLAGSLFAGSALAETVTLRILHVNDWDRMEESSSGKGGFAKMATVLKQESAAAPHVLFTHAGDFVSPSLMSGFDKGAHMVDLLNQSGVGVVALGNHEFDFGPEVAQQRIGEAKFPIVNANAVDASGKLLDGTMKAWIKDVQGMKIGFFGLTTPETERVSSPGEVSFLPVVETAKQSAKQLREAGADLVIALAHIGIEEDWELVRSGSGVDIILSGHDHVVLSYYDGKTALVESGEQADVVSVVDVTMTKETKDDKTRFNWSPSFRTIDTGAVQADPEMAATVQVYLDALSKELDVEIGTAATPLDSRRASVRGGETAIGNLIADAMRDSVKADVGITNGGGIRANKEYPAGHRLTRRDVQSELPFGNRTVKLEVTGAAIKAALENGVAEVENGAGRFPQVSGVTFAYDPKAPAGSRVSDVMVGGQALDMGKLYTVATNDFMARGGDNYTAFVDAKVLIDAKAGKFMASEVVDFIAAKGQVAPSVEGRIKVK